MRDMHLLGDVVYEFSRHLDYVCFPTTAIVSFALHYGKRPRPKMGLTGNDGVVGLLSLWEEEPCRTVP